MRFLSRRRFTSSFLWFRVLTAIQLARCFRDEDLRADRQPEFTQIDRDVVCCCQDIQCVEGFVQRVFKDVLGVDVPTRFRD